MTSVFIRTCEKRHGHREKGHVTMEADFRVMEPQAKESQGLLAIPEAREKQRNSWRLQREHSPADNWVSDFWPSEM